MRHQDQIVHGGLAFNASAVHLPQIHGHGRTVACAVRLGWHAADADIFRVLAQTWGAHCQWLIALTPLALAAKLGGIMIGPSFRARALHVWPLDENQPREPLHMLRNMRPGAAFLPGGPPDVLCAAVDPRVFVSPENVLAAVATASTNNVTLLCDGLFACETRAAASTANANGDIFGNTVLGQLVRPLSCGHSIENVCLANMTHPIVLNSRDAGVMRSLDSAFYRGWPLRGCASPPFAAVAGLPRIGEWRRPRVAVLIGSLLRSFHVGYHLLKRVFADSRVSYSVFVYTAPLFAWNDGGMDCTLVLEKLKRELGSRLEIRYATRPEGVEETEFHAVVGASPMRQFIKLRKAYEMMETRERAEGRKFDLVLKLRTDVNLDGPLLLEDFPQIWSGRVLYTWYDILFFCRRDVARTVIGNLIGELRSRTGDQRKLRPLNYDRLLRLGLAHGVRSQLFPDVGAQDFRSAVEANDLGRLFELLPRYLEVLEAAHQRAAIGDDVTIVTADERFRPETPEYQAWLREGRVAPPTHMCAVAHWFYHLHVAEPEVLVLDWPMPTEGRLWLDPNRFGILCNCEPPSCWPAEWGERE
eukprot:TRINITY_DN30306_c0_g1_i1.p1 TRINITY_DN30306_c0_g1~~TRINITY_DN30306_c0_g1_i1.p1  ORF type:complete len:586 (+),score=73.05 TRINITY_DN30306_c0_g1_i1:141-1898(+)